MNKKNLVLIHLESLSNEILNQNRELFPNLCRIENKSISYSNFFSTATSTLMVLSDLFYGSMLPYEAGKSIRDCESNALKNKALFDELKERGYDTSGVFYPRIDTIDTINKKEIFGKNNKFKVLKDYSDFFKSIDDGMKNDKPFALFVGNIVSHISYGDKKKNRHLSNYENWKEGYKLIDQTVAHVFQLLKDKELLQRSIVILYGDHGDDFWTHSLHNGYTHAIEPYSNIINTPFMIFNEEILPQKVEDIVTTVDIKNIIYKLLTTRPKTSKVIYDIYRSKRQYAFSRNLYANQECNRFGLNKSYSLIDKNYVLIVSCRGMEMYARKQDSSNHNNLLDFYTIGLNGKIKFRTKFRTLHSMHFLDYMTDGEIETVISAFEKMQMELKRRVSYLFKSAHKDNFNREMKFHKIHTIHYYKIYQSYFQFVIKQIKKIENTRNRF